MEKIIIGDIMKNIKGILISGAIIIILTIVTIFIIIQVKSKATDSDDLKNKVDAEMEYLDNKILSMLNGLNNIILRNYMVTSKEVGQSTQETDNESSGISKNSDETEIEADSGNTDNKVKANIQELKKVGVLMSNREANWEILKSEIELLYSSWGTIILDLYKINVNSEDILEFSSLLDETIIYIKEEDKQKSLIALANLYAYIPRYMEKYSTSSENINIQKTKSNLINAYALIDTENWNNISNQIDNAELNYLNVLNSVSTEENYNVNKAYILLKELQNSISEQDKDIFYIKYKNLLEKLNNLSA